MAQPSSNQVGITSYSGMLEYVLEQIQDRLKTPLDDLGDVSDALLNRINRIAGIVYKDFNMKYKTYDEMLEILQDEIPLEPYKDDHAMFILLKPQITICDGKFVIEMPLSVRLVD